MRILFVGSSYLYRGDSGSLELSPYGMFEDMVSAVRSDVDFEISGAGGGALETQWTDPGRFRARDLIETGDYDVVVFQETFGDIPDGTTGHSAVNFEQYARLFTNLATANGSQSVLFSPWTPDYLRSISEGDPYRDPLHRDFLASARANDAAYAPVNLANDEAWRQLTTRFGDDGEGAEDLLTDGQIHSNVHGAYLAAAVVYSTIFDEAPPTNWRPAGLSATDAALLRNIAWSEVQSSGITIDDLGGTTPAPPPPAPEPEPEPEPEPTPPPPAPEPEPEPPTPPRTDLIEGSDFSETLNGDSGVNEIRGNGGSDTLNGFGGNDTLRGGTGQDTLNGGSGNDTLYGDSSVDTLNGDAGNDVLNGGTGVDILNGGNDDDILFGNTGEDELYGDNGDDELSGGSGSDYLDGGFGNDLLLGKDGFDELHGGAGNDVLRGGTGIDMLYGGANDDELHGGTSTDTLYGETGNDTLYGNQGDDELFGGDGRDELFGGSALDTLRGGDDGDVLWGNEGQDTLYGDNGNDTLNGGTGNDFLDGGNDNDTLNAASGNDTLLGGSGNDDLIGGRGNDRSTGGGGADSFIFEADFGADTITDFTTGFDRLELDRALWSGGRDALVDANGYVSGGNFVLDFGDGNSITLNGETDADDIASSIFFF